MSSPLMTDYRLPDGRIVPVDASAAKQAALIDYTLADGRITQAVRADISMPLASPDVETALLAVDHLHKDLDQLAVQIEKLLTERDRIIEVLTVFYRNDISMSSLQLVLDLCRELNPALDERVVR